jgi:hypothetical protein
MKINGINIGFGVHTIVNPGIGGITTNALNSVQFNGTAQTANRLTLVPYIPNVSYTCSNLYINVTTLISGSNARILIYSDSNYMPTTKLYESANLNCATTGIKTATTSFTFEAGTTYWLALHSSSTQGITSATTYGAYPTSYSEAIISNQYNVSVTFGSAPTTITSPSKNNLNIPIIFITVG